MVYDSYRINPDIELNELCKGWKESDIEFYLSDNIGNFCKINKGTRFIYQNGYECMMANWIRRKIISKSSTTIFKFEY